MAWGKIDLTRKGIDYNNSPDFADIRWHFLKQFKYKSVYGRLYCHAKKISKMKNYKDDDIIPDMIKFQNEFLFVNGSLSLDEHGKPTVFIPCISVIHVEPADSMAHSAELINCIKSFT